MLFINPTVNADAAKQYHREHLARSDYYLKEAPEIVGHWHGLGAEAMGLSGPVKQEEYFRLCDNLHPLTGEQLTARTKMDRRVAYDFTFDMPKSASLALELGGDERILDAFRTSVQETMAEVEQAMCVRVRKNGQDHDLVTGNMIFCDFLHRTTRPLADGTPDPHCHIHAVAFNVSYDAAEERWKAGQFGQIKTDAIYYQSAFHARFAKRLSDLGYGIEKDGDSFRLLGIEEEVCERFSRRTQEIETEAEKRGITDLKQKSELGKMTRQGKGKEASLGALRDAWRKKLSASELRAVRHAGTGAIRGKEWTAEAAMNQAIEESFERASVVTAKRLAARALAWGVGSVLPKDIHGQMQRGDIIRADLQGQRYATTEAVCREEMAMLRFASEGRGACAPLAGKPAALDPELSAEQRAAAHTVLQSSDRVIGLRGGAGTGKTRMMQATITAMEKQGQRVFTFAPSSAASRGVLRSEGFEQADTVAQLLSNPKMQQEVAGGVLWIDEAGLLSTREMRDVFRLAEQQHCRVVLAGDSRQHFGVGRGDALRILETQKVVRFAELSEVRRQTHAGYREAVASISRGDALAANGKTHFAAGIEQLDALGAIIASDGEERFEQIAKDYLSATRERRSNGEYKTALVVAPTHAEADRITGHIREGLKGARRITDERAFETLTSLQWGVAERKDATRYRRDMVVQFHQNVKGFQRGERVTVTGRDAQGNVLVTRNGATSSSPLPLAAAERFQVYRKGNVALGVGDVIRLTQNGQTADRKRLDNGAVHVITGFTRDGDLRLANGLTLPKDYGHVAHGYTSTSHASQGKTVDKVFISMGRETLTAVNREQLYVSVSRGREAVRIYTDDKPAMLDAIRTSSARLSATELLQSKALKNTRFDKGRTVHLQYLRRVYDVMRRRGMKALEEARQRTQGIHHGRRS